LTIININNNQYRNLCFIGSTNFKNKVDPTILREGRISTHIFRGPMTFQEKLNFLKAKFRLENVPSDLDTSLRTEFINMTYAQFTIPLNYCKQMEKVAETLRQHTRMDESKNLGFNRQLQRGKIEFFVTDKEGDCPLEKMLWNKDHLTGLVIIDDSDTNLVQITVDQTNGFDRRYGDKCLKIGILERRKNSMLSLIMPMFKSLEIQSAAFFSRDSIHIHQEGDLVDHLASFLEECRQSCESLVVIDVDDLCGFMAMDYSTSTLKEDREHKTERYSFLYPKNFDTIVSFVERNYRFFNNSIPYVVLIFQNKSILQNFKTRIKWDYRNQGTSLYVDWDKDPYPPKKKDAECRILSLGCNSMWPIGQFLEQFPNLSRLEIKGSFCSSDMKEGDWNDFECLKRLVSKFPNIKEIRLPCENINSFQ
jgi:hypothetical protein